MRAPYPCDAPPLGIAPIVVVVHVVMGEHVARGHLGRVVGAAAEETRWWRVHHGRARGIEAVGSVVHGEGVLGVAMSSVVKVVGQLSLADIRGVWLFCEGGRAWFGLCGGVCLVLREMKRCRGSRLQGPERGCRRLADYGIVADCERVRKLVCSRGRR
jgi:hypothetical protein